MMYMAVHDVQDDRPDGRLLIDWAHAACLGAVETGEEFTALEAQAQNQIDRAAIRQWKREGEENWLVVGARDMTAGGLAVVTAARGWLSYELCVCACRARELATHGRAGDWLWVARPGELGQ